MASRKSDIMTAYSFNYVPYPNFSDDKYIYFKLEILCSIGNNTKVIGKCSAIFVKATSEKEAHFSYFESYLYDSEKWDEIGFVVDKENALRACRIVSRAIGK